MLDILPARPRFCCQCRVLAVAALAFQHERAAAPLPTGGPECLQQQSGPCSSPDREMSGSAAGSRRAGAAGTRERADGGLAASVRLVPP